MPTTLWNDSYVTFKETICIAYKNTKQIMAASRERTYIEVGWERVCGFPFVQLALRGLAMKVA